MIKKIAVKTVRLYQRYLSPCLGSRCRFYPSCSEYALWAMEKYGLWGGLKKTIGRILRCNPFCQGGLDLP